MVNMDRKLFHINKAMVHFLCKHGILPAIKKVDDRIAAAENRLGNRLIQLQAGLEAEFIRELRRRGRLPVNANEQKGLLSQIFDTPFESMISAVADGGLEGAEIGRQLTFEDLAEQGLNIAFESFSESVREELRTKIYEFSQDTFSRIRGDFQDTLAKAYEEGVGIDEVAERLRKDFQGLREHRLKNIARTEIQGAQNEGSHQTMINMGVTYKQWLTVGDDRVRGNDPKDEYDHTALHGEVVRLDEAFSNGLMYPGDRSGPIGEWINCRCRERPYIPKRGELIITTPYYPAA
ncbi:phage minor head protein [Halalkalibacterium halodurans]|uniref:phage head morphogenesis protein n=1 Tax=Halalkalibacterium halodurans TaxID=86665 RepID=UPI002E1EA9E3|nr:phage minor head protein [Halalkalibacterium halodurans]